MQKSNQPYASASQRQGPNAVVSALFQLANRMHNNYEMTLQRLYVLINRFFDTYSRQGSTENFELNLLRFGDADPQADMALCVRVLCQQFNLPPERVYEAVEALRGKSSELRLPDSAPATWAARSGEDRCLNPIEFRDKYWKKYLDAGIMYQVDLRAMDNSLFEAIKSWCRNKKIRPQDHLPPRNVSRIARCLNPNRLPGSQLG